MSKTRALTAFIMILTVLNGVLFMYLVIKNAPSEKDINIRQNFTTLTGLPDISVYTESPSERFRSLTDTGSIFSSGPFAPDTDFSAIIYKKAEFPK